MHNEYIKQNVITWTSLVSYSMKEHEYEARF